MKVINEVQINEYSSDYTLLFLNHRHSQIRHCTAYIAGLLHECKSNMERMAERVPSTEAQNLQHFISNSPWSAAAVMQKTAGLVSDRLSVLGKPVGLLFDESGWEKNGKHSVGVGHQYIGNVGKRCNSQNAVFAALTCEGNVGIVGGKLYLPHSWIDDPKRGAKAGIPKEDMVYLTKPELAIALHKSLVGVTQHDFVGGDAIYGNSPTLRHYLESVEETFVLDVGEGLGVYLNHPQPAIPPRTSKRGASPTAYQTTEKKVILSNLMAQFHTDGGVNITHRTGTKGKLTRKAVVLDVFIWDSVYQDKVETLQLLISSETDGREVKFSLCFQKEGKMSLEDAVFRQMQRYFVERAFQNAKEHLGLHQYQVRTWKAWHHHIALSMMALDFLLAQQLLHKEEYPLISCPDIRIAIARSLTNNFNSHEYVVKAMQKRHLQRQKDINIYNKT